MTEGTTRDDPAVMEHSSAHASLAALGVHLRHLDLFGPIRQQVRIPQKTVRYSPTDKLYDAFIALLAGAQGLVEINGRLRPDPALQAAFGRTACAEQSVVQDTLDACSDETVAQLEAAWTTIYRRHGQGSRHDYAEDWQILDADMSGLPCGKKAAMATAGYFAKQRNRRGRQLGGSWPRAIGRSSSTASSTARRSSTSPCSPSSRRLKPRWSWMRRSGSAPSSASTPERAASRTSIGCSCVATSSSPKTTRPPGHACWPHRSKTGSSTRATRSGRWARPWPGQRLSRGPVPPQHHPHRGALSAGQRPVGRGGGRLQLARRRRLCPRRPGHDGGHRSGAGPLGLCLPLRPTRRWRGDLLQGGQARAWGSPSAARSALPPNRW